MSDMKKRKRIIVCADDFGRSAERNRAIDDAMRSGLIRCAGLMMSSDYTEDALDYAFRGGYINNIHCHLNLSSGLDLGNHFLPLDESFKKNRLLCTNGEFTKKNLDNPFYYFKCRMDIYKELEKQFMLFKSMTRGKGNYDHIDFHLYYNTKIPVAYAYSRLIVKQHIRTARYYGEHHKRNIKGLIKIGTSKLFRYSNEPTVKSCNADYFSTMFSRFELDELVEVYCHPEYQDGVLMDNSKSSFGHSIKPLEQSMQDIYKENEIIAWNDV